MLTIWYSGVIRIEWEILMDTGSKLKRFLGLFLDGLVQKVRVVGKCAL